jgi:hypothetical protein
MTVRRKNAVNSLLRFERGRSAAIAAAVSSSGENASSFDRRSSTAMDGAMDTVIGGGRDDT